MSFEDDHEALTYLISRGWWHGRDYVLKTTQPKIFVSRIEWEAINLLCFEYDWSGWETGVDKTSPTEKEIYNDFEKRNKIKAIS